MNGELPVRHTSCPPRRLPPSVVSPEASHKLCSIVSHRDYRHAGMFFAAWPELGGRKTRHIGRSSRRSQATSRERTAEKRQMVSAKSSFPGCTLSSSPVVFAEVCVCACVRVCVTRSCRTVSAPACCKSVKEKQCSFLRFWGEDESSAVLGWCFLHTSCV